MTWFKHIAKVDEKYMGVEGKKNHDSQVQFSSRIIVAIIIIIKTITSCKNDKTWLQMMDSCM
jgi:hypothetical protein